MKRRLIITRTAKAISLELAIAEYKRQEVRANGHTKKAKEHDLTHFVVYIREAVREQTPLLLDVTRAVVEDFLKERLQTEAPATVQRRLSTVRHFCRRMAEQFEDYRNPCICVKGPIVDKGEPPRLSKEEKTRLRNYIASNEDAHRATRNQLILELGLRQGLRCAEMCDLCLAHVNLESGILSRFLGKGQRFHNMRMHPAVRALVAQYNHLREDEIRKKVANYDELPEHIKLQFPYLISITGARKSEARTFRINEKTVWRVCNEAGKAIGVKLWTHKLRHTAVKDFYAASEHDIYKTAEYARHRNVNTTLTYARSSVEEVGNTLEEME